MAKYTYISDPVTERAKKKWTRQRHRDDGVSTLPPGFSFKPQGRAGTIYYREDDRVLEMFWEMSGVPQFDILLNLQGIQNWVLPDIAPVTEDDRARIRSSLTEWLKYLGCTAELTE